MGELWIDGGKPLSGSVRIQGSKNAALPCMAAALLYEGECVLEGCPKIEDVFCMERILNSLGARSRWEGQNLILDCSEAEGFQISSKDAGAMRSSIILLGPLMVRNGKAVLGAPGGCAIGKRPFDLHLMLLEKMGADISKDFTGVTAQTPKMTGTDVFLTSPSVGATEQGILSAVCAEGKTVLFPCAREPEILCLCRFLTEMGAEIYGSGSEQIEIFGKGSLLGVGEKKTAKIKIPADRIVAGTYLCASAATRGKIILENAPFEELEAFLDVYKKMGGQYKQKSGKLIADSTGSGYPIPFLETSVYPGFPTDLQSPVLAVLALAKGESCIRENIFENRFQIVGELEKMGARIQVEGRTARIHGVSALAGSEMTARELRGGAALVVAALAAKGCSVIRDCRYIRRGYEDICRDLTALGGRLRENSGN